MDVLVALSSPLGVTGVGVGVGVRTVIVMLSSSLPVMLPAPQLHSAAAALAPVHCQRSLRRRLHEPRARALAASPQDRSRVRGEAKPRRQPRRLPLSRHRRRPAHVDRRRRGGQPAARRWRRRRCGDGRPGGVTGSLQGPRYPPSCCRGEQPAGRRVRPPGCHRRPGIPRLPRNRGRYRRASLPPHSGRMFPVGGSPGTISDSWRR